MTAPAIPRCWADAGSQLVADRAVECQALGTGRLGLCPRHDREIGYCMEPLAATRKRPRPKEGPLPAAVTV